MNFLTEKIYPDDVAAPTHKSRLEENFEKISSKIVPGLRKQKEETEEGSARGTISPFDDENDSQKNRIGEEQNYYRGEDRGEEKESRFETNRQNINIKEMERIASKIKPDIPSDEDEIPIKESASNTRDIGSPANVFVNMSGEPHNYGDGGREEDYPAPNRSFRPDLAENENKHPIGDYYPNEEENWSRPHDDREDDSEGFKKSLDEFQMKFERLAAISKEGGKKREYRIPVVVHPDADPLNGDLKKAFYEFHPTRHLSQHLATISDFNVRSEIQKVFRQDLDGKKNLMKKIPRNRRSLIADRLIHRLRKSA